MAECFGYSRSWFSEILGKLKAARLLTHAPHVSTCAEGNRNDGTLFALCLRSAEAFREGARAPRLDMAYFCHSYRNLERDRKNKHTFYYVKKLFLDLTGHSRRLILMTCRYAQTRRKPCVEGCIKELPMYVGC